MNAESVAAGGMFFRFPELFEVAHQRHAEPRDPLANHISRDLDAHH